MMLAWPEISKKYAADNIFIYKQGFLFGSFCVNTSP